MPDTVARGVRERDGVTETELEMLGEGDWVLLVLEERDSVPWGVLEELERALLLTRGLPVPMGEAEGEEDREGERVALFEALVLRATVALMEAEPVTLEDGVGDSEPFTVAEDDGLCE